MAGNRVLSREDHGLNQSTARLITTRSRLYKDIDLSFTAKPNGELYIKRDAAAVKQAIKTLIQTNYFEKPYQPFFGADIRSLLFELADDDIEEEVQEQVIEAIEKYEPRAAIIDVRVRALPDYNSISVTIEFQVVNTSEVVVFTTSISRLR
jgi:phage baseplate assembly protein W